MRHIAAKVPHDAERVREEGFHVEVWKTFDSGRILRLVCALPAREPHFVEAIDEFADFTVFDILSRAFGGWSKMVI